MLLGKRPRPRPPMRRTTSVTVFAVDMGVAVAPQQSDHERAHYQRAASPRGGVRRSSEDFAVVETADFLRSCGLCKRRLGPGRDTFMYRGDTAFCSLECRQQQMNLDERRDKCSLKSMKKDDPPATATGSESSNSGETMAVA